MLRVYKADNEYTDYEVEGFGTMSSDDFGKKSRAVVIVSQGCNHMIRVWNDERNLAEAAIEMLENTKGDDIIGLRIYKETFCIYLKDERDPASLPKQFSGRYYIEP